MRKSSLLWRLMQMEQRRRSAVVSGVTVNATGSEQYGAPGISKNYTGITVAAGSNRGLVLAVLWGYAVTPPSSITCVWDQAGANQSMTEIIRLDSPSGGATAALYGLVAPATGNKTLTISWTGIAEIFPAAMAFDGVDQTGGVTSFPHSASANGAAADQFGIDVTSAVGNKVMAAMSSSSVATISTGTEIFKDTSSGAFINANANYDAGAASVFIGATRAGFTVTLHPIVATDIKAA